MNKKRQKLMILLGNGLGQFGSTILSFVLGLHILRTLNSVFLYSISQIIGPLVAILLLPVLGSAIDKFNKNKIIRISQISSCLAICCFAFISNGKIIDYLQIIVLLVVLKISDQVLSTTLTASTINVVDADEVQSFRSKIQLIQAGSMVLSPIIAIFIIDKFTLSGVLFIELFIEFLVLIIYWSINFHNNKTTINSDTSESQSLLLMFKEGVQFIFKYKKIVFGFVFVLAINFILGIVNVGLPYVQIKVLDFSNGTYALNDSILAIGLLLGSILGSQIKSKGTLNIVRYAISLIAVGTFLIGLLLAVNLSKNVWFVAFAVYYLILGLSITLCNILISSWSIIKIPEEYQGRVFAVLNALTQISLPLSMLLFGYLFDIINVVTIFVVAGVILLLITLIVPKLFGIKLASDELE